MSTPRKARENEKEGERLIRLFVFVRSQEKGNVEVYRSGGCKGMFERSKEGGTGRNKASWL